LFDIDCEIEKLAQSLASRIVLPQQDVNDHDDVDYREIDLDSIEMSKPRSVGREHVALEALRFLGLDEKLAELGFNGPQTAAAIGTIIGRACEPGSELATHAWLQDRSALGELIGYDYDVLSLYGMYQISDRLLGKKEEVEEQFYDPDKSAIVSEKREKETSTVSQPIGGIPGTTSNLPPPVGRDFDIAGQLGGAGGKTGKGYWK